MRDDHSAEVDSHREGRERRKRQCRICLEYESVERVASPNPMLRPCRCSGSMAWVHLQCLNAWRSNSSNPKSFYECDQCKFAYVFGRKQARAFELARLLGTRGVAHLVSICALVVAVYLGGFVGGLVAPELPENLGALDHWLKGSLVVAVVSLATASVFGLVRGGDLYRRPYRRFSGVRFSKRSSSNRVTKFDAIILAITLVVGLSVALYGIYGALVSASRKMAHRAQRVVLDAPFVHEDDDDDVDAPPEDDPPQTERHRGPSSSSSSSSS
ncbi:hypothetical protein CTAYLR_009561 [Chrysophaeum taylorii]|uniref:RING-CH-type domain-containing protein n=1 Tax=Chrysophaeum taylorii TaxID=2483200 RepID=A0AAD7UJL9_9STRA|nr:hypothetical protein CTAYLR_009561 [Chrysophaeum taylorii]